MVEAGIRSVEFVALNTDAQDLRRNKSSIRIQIGENLTKGLGVGGDPVRGRQAALESAESIKELLAGADLIFVTAGMGGGTGTGGAPVVAQLARDTSALVIGVVTRPFDFEGRIRAAQAEAGIKEMRNYVDSLLIIPNERLFNIIDKTTTSQEAYRLADDVLRQAIQGISDLITTAGDINVDFADVKKIMIKSGDALIGIGQMSGPNRHLEAAKKAIDSPLLEHAVIEGASGVLVNFTGSKDITIHEISEAMEFIRRSASQDANVKFGQAYDDSLGDAIKITVIATGIKPKETSGFSEKGRLAGKKRILPYPHPQMYQGDFLEQSGQYAQKDFETGGASEELLKPAYLRRKTTKLK